MSAEPKKTWRRWLWPSGLTGQIILLIVLTIVISQAINVVLVAGERADAFRRGAAGPLIDQTVIAAELLQSSDEATQARLLKALSGRERRVTIDATALAQSSKNSQLTDRLANKLKRESGLHALVEARFIEKRFQKQRTEAQRERNGRPDRPRFKDRPNRPMQVDRLIVSLELSPNRWLNMIWRLPSRDLDWLRTSLIFNIGLALALSILAILFLRRVTRPMKDLAIAADALGRGEDVPALAEKGPREIKQATAAFNAMQDRLSRFVKDRTQMLAAISHDLRTPITSLRLRTELLDDEEARDNMVRTLDEMQSMTESVLAFARDDATSEGMEDVDVLALLEDCASTLRAQGARIDFGFNSAQNTKLRGRPLALKRAISNLLQNAILYGEQAEVSVSSNKDTLSFKIRDHGPGIPEARMEEMFKPFARMESSRNRETGGTGLGLSIVRSIIHSHGGDISLQNASEGGLIVTVNLPLA
ncbi:MAG: ATP-binding protein [Hyphomicrobiales bacterium]